MPKIAELREIDGSLWVKLEMNADEGQVTLWTAEEIEEHSQTSVKDFLNNLFQQWIRP
jgi:hypothetical protein